MQPPNSFYSRFYWLAEPGEDLSRLRLFGHTRGQKFCEQWKESTTLGTRKNLLPSTACLSTRLGSKKNLLPSTACLSSSSLPSRRLTWRGLQQGRPGDLTSVICSRTVTTSVACGFQLFSRKKCMCLFPL